MSCRRMRRPRRMVNTSSKVNKWSFWRENGRCNMDSSVGCQRPRGAARGPCLGAIISRVGGARGRGVTRRCGKRPLLRIAGCGGGRCGNGGGRSWGSGGKALGVSAIEVHKAADLIWFSTIFFPWSILFLFKGRECSDVWCT